MTRLDPDTTRRVREGSEVLIANLKRQIEEIKGKHPDRFSQYDYTRIHHLQERIDKLARQRNRFIKEQNIHE